MRLLARSLAGTTVAFLAAGATALAQGENCTHDTLAADATPILATFCVSGPPAARVTVTETFVRGTERISRPLVVDVVSGATVTRVVDDVPLTELGSNKQLHLTVAYRSGAAVLEHALLLPGAIVLK
jgi:thiamine monophosphate kinase